MVIFHISSVVQLTPCLRPTASHLSPGGVWGRNELIDMNLDSGGFVVCDSRDRKQPFLLLPVGSLFKLCPWPRTFFFLSLPGEPILSLVELSLTFSGKTNPLLHCAAFAHSLRSEPQFTC